MSNDEFVKVVLKNTKDQPVAPMTTADQVIYDGGTIIDAFNDAYNAATSAYNLANRAYSKAYEAYDEAVSAYSEAEEAYSEAASAYNRADHAYDEANDAHSTANEAYDLANTNSEYLGEVKDIFQALAGTMYNPGTEDSMGYIYGGNPTVAQINSNLNIVSGQADSAYNIANDAYYIAGSIYNRESGKAADSYNAGSYLLKATVDSNKNISFTWVNEADYKNPQNN